MSGSEGSSGHSAGDSAVAAEKKAKSKVSRTSMILWHSHQNDFAAVRKMLEECQSLVQAGDYDNRTPLHVASLHGWTDVAKCLIEYGVARQAQAKADEIAKLMNENENHDQLMEDSTEDGGVNEENNFPHAYFFLRYMCNRKNCWGTLAPLPPSNGIPSSVMECNVCGNMKNDDAPLEE